MSCKVAGKGPLLVPPRRFVGLKKRPFFFYCREKKTPTLDYGFESRNTWYDIGCWSGCVPRDLMRRCRAVLIFHGLANCISHGYLQNEGSLVSVCWSWFSYRWTSSPLFIIIIIIIIIGELHIVLTALLFGGWSSINLPFPAYGTPGLKSVKPPLIYQTQKLHCNEISAHFKV